MKKAGIKIDRSTVMSEANAMFAADKNLTRSQAVKAGYKVAKIYALFAAGLMATVTFVKGHGTERLARMLPSKTGEYLIKGTGRTTPKANILFCDVDLGGAFRSCVKSRILTVA